MFVIKDVFSLLKHLLLLLLLCVSIEAPVKLSICLFFRENEQKNDSKQSIVCSMLEIIMLKSWWARACC